MWGHRHDKLYPGRTNYEFDLMQPPTDPKERRRWKKIRWLLLATIVLILCGIVIKWEEWLAGDDPDFIVGELAWPGFDHREKVFTLRCHNNCSDHATVSPCNPTNQTYCTCDRGYLGFDCSLALCTKCRIPDVVIIGVQKGGTTALNHYLRFNPAFMLGQKDHFFDEHWDRGLVWYFSLWDYSRDILNEPVDSSKEGGEDDDATYESLELNDEEEILATETNEEKDKDREEARDPEELEVEHDVEKEDLLADTPLSFKQRIKVGGSPKYIIDDIAMEKLYALHPGVKFIVLLRNPTTRAYSGALMNERKGFFSHVLTEDEKGLLGSLWRDLRQERRRMSKSQSEQEAIEEALATDGELVFEGTIDLNNPSDSSSRKLLSVPETAEISRAKEALKTKLAEYSSKPFTPEETEKVLLRAVEVVTACIEEAQRLNGTSFFREVISPELEELIKERGTDLQAFYEWKACFSVQAPLITSAHTFRHLGGYDDIKVDQLWDEADGLVLESRNGFSRHLIIVRPIAWASISRGLYYHQLNEWLTYFNKDQFLILRSEDMLESPQKIMDEVHSWLGASKFTYGQSQLEPVNPATNNEPMTETTKKALDDFFTPYNRQLNHLLRRNMRW